MLLRLAQNEFFEPHLIQDAKPISGIE